MIRTLLAVYFTCFMSLFIGYLLLTVNFRRTGNKEFILTLALSVLTFGMSYMFLTYIRLYDSGESIPVIFERISRAYLEFPLAGILLAFFLYLVLKNKIRAGNVSVHAIYQGINTLKSGFCVFEKSGHMRMVNEKMDELSYLATGEYLYDGLRFHQFIESHEKENEIEIGGSYYSCLVRNLTVENRYVTEMILTDITEEHKLHERLIEERKRRTEYQEKLKKYSEDMKEVVRTEEILNTKTQIHAEFGNLLLEGKYSLTHREEREGFLKNVRNVMDLSLTKDTEKKDFLGELYKIASSIGMNLHLEEEILEEHVPAVYRLLQECITNSYKHAGAKNLYLDVMKDESETRYVVYNDGKNPSGKITEGGGMSAVRGITEKLGGTMEYRYEPGFQTILFFRRENQS